MGFSSITFLFIFLPLIVITYFLIPKKYKDIHLLISSIIFYMHYSIMDTIILILVTLYNFYRIKCLSKEKKKKKKYILIEILIVNVFLLLYFKYYYNILNAVFDTFSFKKMLIPIGMSFYLFTIISCAIDVYKKKVRFDDDILKFSLYVGFFPKLLMGPIVRYKDFCREYSCHRDFPELELGTRKFIIGLSMKTILADTLSKIIIEINPISTLSILFLMLLYTFQIYFDFVGYNYMSLGLSNVFGFNFMSNFNYPYQSKSCSEFWNRWHISLGKWFKDYVYIPLGGNRVSKKRLMINILIVWLLTGIWHGSSFNFVIWGLYFGGILLLEKLFLKERQIPDFIKTICTFFLISFGWLIFFTPDIKLLIKYILTLFNFTRFTDINTLSIIKNYLLYIIICFICSCPIIKMLGEQIKKINVRLYDISTTILLVMLLILSISYIASNSYNPFLYFNF